MVTKGMNFISKILPIILPKNHCPVMLYSNFLSLLRIEHRPALLL